MAPSFTVGYQESICCGLRTSDFYGCCDIGGLRPAVVWFCVLVLSLDDIVHGALCVHANCKLTNVQTVQLFVIFHSVTYRKREKKYLLSCGCVLITCIHSKN